MKEEAQRIAIAEALELDVLHDGRLSPTGTLMVRKIGITDWYVQKDWLSDLNAMHEAEKILTPEEGWAYAQNLVVDGGKGWFATAAQRAEAFLKTLGLWKEDAARERSPGVNEAQRPNK